jgi:hypothetical protein
LSFAKTPTKLRPRFRGELAERAAAVPLGVLTREDSNGSGGGRAGGGRTAGQEQDGDDGVEHGFLPYRWNRRMPASGGEVEVPVVRRRPRLRLSHQRGKRGVHRRGGGLQ